MKLAVCPPTVGFGAAPLLFELIGLAGVGWLLPFNSAQRQHLGLTTESANRIAAVKVDQAGLHMMLPADSPRPGIITWRDDRWPDIWKIGDETQEYEGGEALAVWQMLNSAYVPPKRGRGERGASRSIDAAVKRNALDAFMAHVLVKNLEAGAGVFSAAIDQVATDHPDLTKIVWPSRYACDTGDPHNIRKHMQREIKKALIFCP